MPRRLVDRARSSVSVNTHRNNPSGGYPIRPNNGAQRENAMHSYEFTVEYRNGQRDAFTVTADYTLQAFCDLMNLLATQYRDRTRGKTITSITLTSRDGKPL